MELIWLSFLKVCGIRDLRRIPQIEDPEHPHVKTIIFLYTMESFVFVRLNQISRQKDPSCIETLGPYAVALTKVINTIEQKRTDKRMGEFYCYRGLVLKRDEIEKWTKKKELELDGYSSTSFSEKIARNFAN